MKMQKFSERGLTYFEKLHSLSPASTDSHPVIFLSPSSLAFLQREQVLVWGHDKTWVLDGGLRKTCFDLNLDIHYGHNKFFKAVLYLC
jgi:hypothetical protein